MGLAKMKRFDPDLYKARVRASRIRTATDPPDCTSGVDSKRTRVGVMAETVNTLTQLAQLQGRHKLKWMAKGMYLSHLKWK